MALVCDIADLLFRKFGEVKPVLRFVPLLMQDQRGHTHLLELIKAIFGRKKINIVTLDLDAAIEVEGVADIGVFGKRLDGGCVEAEVEIDGAVGQHAACRIAIPFGGV